MNEQKIQAGKLLIAEPFMMDANFKRSVVLLCDHHPDGTLGFILNKPLSMNIMELIADFPEFESEVYYGGPVATDTIHYIHNAGGILDDSLEIERGVFWGGDFDKLKFLIQTKLILPKNIRFYVGYSGWSEGQLKEELKYGSWVTAEMHANYIFKTKPNRLWKQVLSNKGKNFEVIAEMPDSQSWN